MNARTRVTRTGLALALIAAFAGLLAGCGSGGSIAGAAVGAAIGSTLDDDRSRSFADPYTYEESPGEYENEW